LESNLWPIQVIYVILFVASGIYSCKTEPAKLMDKSSAPIVDVIMQKKINVPTTIEVNGSALSEEMIELHRK